MYMSEWEYFFQLQCCIDGIEYLYTKYSKLNKLWRAKLKGYFFIFPPKQIHLRSKKLFY